MQGVGPKAALAILGLGEVETVRNAIATTDISFITGASGVGKKSAERIAVSLQDKVGQPSCLTSDRPTGSLIGPNDDEALDALIALGFNLVDATRFLSDVPADLPTNERVRLALKRRS